MTTKTKVIIFIVYTAAVAGVSRYGVPAKVVTQIKTVEVEKKVAISKEDTNKNTHRKRKTTEVKKPNGETVTTTIEVEDDKVDQKQDTTTTHTADTTIDSTKTVEHPTDKTTLSLLGGVSLFGGDPAHLITYGAAIQKPVLGPFTLGAFVFNDGRLGMSIGISF